MTVKLVTGEHHDLVADAEIPPFQKIPEIIAWGDRLFVHRAFEMTIPVYREAMGWVITGQPGNSILEKEQA